MDRGEQRMGEANAIALARDHAQSGGTLDVRFYGCRVLGRGAELQERRLRKRRDRKQHVLRVAGEASEAAVPPPSRTSCDRDRRTPPPTRTPAATDPPPATPAAAAAARTPAVCHAAARTPPRQRVIATPRPLRRGKIRHVPRNDAFEEIAEGCVRDLRLGLSGAPGEDTEFRRRGLAQRPSPDGRLAHAGLALEKQRTRSARNGIEESREPNELRVAPEDSHGRAVHPYPSSRPWSKLS